MTDVYADAGYWIAMLNPSDQWHASAVMASKQIEGRRVVTSEMVLVEFLNSVSRFGPQVREQAIATAKRLYNNPNVEIIKQTSLQLNEAMERYLLRPDQRWSVTDCASFLIMEEREMSEALAHDRDFEQAGFRALLREV